MIFPSILAKDLQQALMDLGADLSTGRSAYFQGIFQGHLVICYHRGEFAELICKHEPTLDQIRQILTYLVKPGNNSPDPLD